MSTPGLVVSKLDPVDILQALMAPASSVNSCMHNIPSPLVNVLYEAPPLLSCDEWVAFAT